MAHFHFRPLPPTAPTPPPASATSSANPGPAAGGASHAAPFDHEASDPAVMLFTERWNAGSFAPARPRPAIGRVLLNDRALATAALLILLIALASALGGGSSSTSDESPSMTQTVERPLIDAPDASPSLPPAPVQDLWGIYYP